MMISTFKRYNSFTYFSLIPVAILYLISMAIVSDGFILSREGLLVALSITFLISLMMMMNAYADREIDEIVHPERALPSKKVSLKEARFLIAFTIIIAIVPVVFTNYMNIVLVESCLILLYGVVCFLKHSQANTSSAFGLFYFFAAPLFLGGCFYLIGFGILGRDDLFLLLFSLVFSLFDIGHDVYGCILDKEGDDKLSLKTIIKICGEKVAFFMVVGADILAFVFAGYYLVKNNNLIEVMIFLLITLFFEYKLFKSNIGYYQKRDRQSAFSAREWHNWATYAIGFLLVGIKLKPVYIFAPIGLIVIVMTYISTIKSEKQNTSYLK